ncbi:MAG: TIGR03435 family protein [Verrucomicrobiota bacterium]
MDDIALLRQYAEGNSESAFSTLAEKYVNLVYSTALRSIGNPHAAEEITQAVFIILARKARGLSGFTALSGWLYQTTRLTAANFLRGEIRRQKREQEAYMQSILNEPGPEVWPRISPLLDDAMGRLGEKDRNAIVLRYFENKSLSEVGLALGASEDAAKMRVNRALEKLRKSFTKRGVTLSGALIVGAVSANSVHAAPAGMAKAISAVAVAKGAAAGGSTLTLVKGALKLMAWTRAKTAIVAGVGILFAAGTATITVKEIQEHQTYSWQIPGFDSRVLDRQRSQVEILSSSVLFPAWGTSDKSGHLKLMGTGVTAENIVQTAYGFWTSARTVLNAELPQGKYDYIASLPSGNELALQQEIRKQFGVVAQRETRTTDVLLLEVRNPDALGLRPSRGRNSQDGASFNSSQGQWSFKNSRLSMLVGPLENYLGTPVVDQTGITDKFDIDLKFNELNSQHPILQNVRQALLDQLGLELVATNTPIEMLVVEKSN